MIKRALITLLSALALIGALFFILTAPGKAPDFAAVQSRWVPSQSTLLDRNGLVLHALRTDFHGQRGAWTRLDAVSSTLQKTIIAAEDKRFYRHHGIDWAAVLAALWSNARGRPLRGASTISMQLATLLQRQKTPNHKRRSLMAKIRQARLAMAIERKWTKGQILESYLNLVDFRGEIEGIDAAATHLLGKHPAGLNRDESLALAALLPAPNTRRDTIEKRFCQLGTITEKEFDCARAKPVLAGILNRAAHPPALPALAPHLAARLLQASDAPVMTTLDKPIQAHAVEALASQLARLNNRNVRDGAILVVDNQSGDILAWVGSNPATSHAPHVDGVRAHRQAGSTLKPHLYALAIEKHYMTAASLLKDAPIYLETIGGLYVPQNYDHDYKGPVSARTALGNSLNIPAVRTLVLTGVEPFRERLEAMGYAGIIKDSNYYGYALALGAAEVSLAEQVNAYRTLANGGMARSLRLIKERKLEPARRILSEQSAFIVADMMSDRSARVLTFGLANALNTPFWSAVKTGTSKAMRDNWCIGFSRRYTVGVWIGNFEGDAMHNVTGVSGAAPLWHDMLTWLEGDSALPAPPAPAGLVHQSILFTPPLEAPRREWFITGTQSSQIRLAPKETRTPRITRPAQGEIIALDPDIPPERQKVIFTIRNDRETAALFLDDVKMDKNTPWFPLPGRHHLILKDKAGSALDRVNFQVRALVSAPDTQKTP